MMSGEIIFLIMGVAIIFPLCAALYALRRGRRGWAWAAVVSILTGLGPIVGLLAVLVAAGSPAKSKAPAPAKSPASPPAAPAMPGGPKQGVTPLPNHMRALLDMDTSVLKRHAAIGTGVKIAAINEEKGTRQEYPLSPQDLQWALRVTSLADAATHAVDQGDLQQGLNLWLQAYELAPAYPVIAMSLGVVYGEMGDVQTSIAYLEEAQRLDPTNERIARNLAVARELAAPQPPVPATPKRKADMPPASPPPDATVFESTALPPSDATVIELSDTPPAPTAPAVSTEGTPAAWQPGDVILELYEITGLLGEGGMGTVHKVHHKGWNVDLAVKSPRPAIFADARGQELFVREAETWVNLGLHPHIVSCAYVRTLGGIPRVFAEYVEGGSLADWVRNRRLYEGGPQQALARILDLAIQFAWGLDYAHAQGLVHQDVKPANVMLTSDGTAKVTDFGLAKARAAAEERAPAGVAGGGQSLLVSAGGMTPAYCSPEQAAGEPLSRATDIWSWAVSILELFVGEVTWPAGQVASAALESYLEDGPPEPDVPPMPPALAEMLRRCFRPNPEDRPATMAEVAAILQDIYAQEVGQTYPHEAPDPAELLADSLNNQALSLLDLKRPEEAERLWEQALQIDPHHPHASYNHGLHLWRAGRMTDDELVSRMEVVRTTHQGDWVDEYLLALVHLERGDTEAAIPLLEEAARAAKNERAVAATIEAARRGKDTGAHFLRALEGHGEQVTAVALTPDGRRAISRGMDGTIRLWDLTTGHCEETLTDYTSAVFTDDCRLILIGKSDNTIQLRNLVDNKLTTYSGFTDRVEPLTLSPQGRLAILKAGERAVIGLDLETGRHRFRIDSETPITAMAFTPDDRLALFRYHQTPIFELHDLSAGHRLHVLAGHQHWISAAAITPDGHTAVSASWDHTLRVWDLTTGHCLRVLRGHTEMVWNVALTPDGRLALSGGQDQTLRLWEVASGRCLRTFTGHRDGIHAVALTPDGRLALSGGGNPHGSQDYVMRLWQLGSQPGYQAQWSYTRPRAAAALSEEATQVRQALSKANSLIVEGHFQAAASELQSVRSRAGYERHPRLLASWRQAGRGGRRVAVRGAWLTRTLEGHTGAITGLAVTPDGQLALSGSSDQTLRLWDIDTGRCLHVLTGHTDRIRSVAITPDSRFALSGGHDQDHALRLWDLTTGQYLRSLVGHSDAILSVAFTPDGSLALSGSNDQTLRLWDIETGRCLRVFEGHTNPVRVVRLSPDGRWALSGSGNYVVVDDPDNTIRLWDTSTGRCLRVLGKHPHDITSVALTTDGRFALSSSTDSYLRLWDVATGRCVRTLTYVSGMIHVSRDAVNTVALTTDGRYALAGNNDNTLRIWDLTRGRCVQVLEGHPDSVACVALTADGHYALSGTVDASSVSGHLDTAIRLWELDWDYEFPTPAGWDEGTRPYIETFLTLHTPYAAALPPDRELTDEDVTLALTRRGMPTWTDEDFRNLIGQLQYAGYGWLRPEGVRAELERLARDQTEGSMVHTVGQPHEQPPALRLTPDAVRRPAEPDLAQRAPALEQALTRARDLLAHGDARATAAELRTVRNIEGYAGNSDLLEIWQQVGQSGRRAGLLGAWYVRTLEGHTNSVQSLAITVDGRFALSGSTDATLRLWDLPAGHSIRTFQMGDETTPMLRAPDGSVLGRLANSVHAVALTPDGRLACSVSTDNILRLWDVTTGQCLRTLAGHTSEITSVVLTSDGRLALSGSGDRTMRLWDLTSGQSLHIFQGHEQAVRAVCLSADGRLALSGGKDETLRLWDVAAGRCLHALEGHTGTIWSVAITPDSRLALTGSEDWTLRVWDLTTGRCLRTLEGHAEAVRSVALTADGRCGLSVSDDRTLRLWNLATGRCLCSIEDSGSRTTSAALTPDGRFILTGEAVLIEREQVQGSTSEGGTVTISRSRENDILRLWELDWDYDFPDLADWDEGARPTLETFLTRHTPFAAALPQDRAPFNEEIRLALTRYGQPIWNEEDFQSLIYELQQAGYGWLRPEGVRAELERMVANGRGAERADVEGARWHIKGMTLATQGRYEDALQCYIQGLALAPGDGILWQNQGLALYNLGRHQQALESFNRSLEIIPGAANIWMVKGLALDALGRQAEALESYDHGLELTPKDGTLWMNKGVALYRLHRHTEALACYDRAMEFASQSSLLWRNRGAALYDLKRFAEALTCFDRAIELGAHDAGLRKIKGLTLEALGRRDEALACYERGLELAPRDAALWLFKGTILEGKGQPAEAIDCYDRGLEIAPGEINLWINKGVALYRLQRFAEALACYDRGLALAPQQSLLWRNKAAALYDMKRFAEALSCLDRALDLAPHDGLAWQLKGATLQVLGRAQEAQECLRRAQKLSGG